MFLEFEKWQACSNDFIVIWTTFNESKFLLDSLRRNASLLCSRSGLGIGADGVLLIQSQSKHDAFPSELVIINQDGSLAKNCGNGLRCVAMSILKRYQLQSDDTPESVGIKIGESIFQMNFLGQHRPWVRVGMGRPLMDQEVEDFKKSEAWIKETLAASKFHVAEIHRVNLHNPHIVLRGDSPDKPQFLEVAAKLQKSPFWDGINVHFAHANLNSIPPKEQIARFSKIGVSVANENLSVFTFERGVGPTLSCGSGSCAVASALSFATGFVDRSEILPIETEGGWLFVRHPDKEDDIELMGPAELVFTGRFEI